jgi:hypothetical protein
VKPYPLDECNLALADLKHSRFNGEAVLRVSGVRHKDSPGRRHVFLKVGFMIP